VTPDFRSGSGGRLSLVTRLTFLHGSVTNADRSWRGQRVLAERFEVATPNRPGFPPGPPIQRVDFDAEVPWLASIVRRGDHLVAHSYGGVVALLAAPSLPLASLTLIEPPAFGVAPDDPAVRSWLERSRALPQGDLRTYVDAFLELVGAPLRLPDPLPDDLRQGAEAFVAERRPDEARIPLEPLRYPVLVVTGDHEPAFDAVADVLVARLGAERAVVRGAGHAAQFAPGFNEVLVRFVQAACDERRVSAGG
jgi:pimeloyl-ACP methyl ester carboxylesterase